MLVAVDANRLDGHQARVVDEGAHGSVEADDLTPDKMPLFLEGVARVAAKLGVTPVPPLTGVGVAALAEPDLLVEVEATAVLD